MNWKHWFKGLISAAIGSAANAVTVTIIDPATFNPFEGGLKKLGTFMLVSAIVSAALYLKTHPIDCIEIKEECVEEVTDETKP